MIVGMEKQGKVEELQKNSRVVKTGEGAGRFVESHRCK